MNYIQRLQNENQEMADALKDARAEIMLFRAHLDTPKYTGVDCNGERKDWIATADVYRWLDRINGATWI